MLYSVELRSYHGDTLASGTGRTYWKNTLTRLARQAGISAGAGVANDNYFRTDLGAPFGTHHIQFGSYSRKAGGTVLSKTYIVSVRPLDTEEALAT